MKQFLRNFIIVVVGLLAVDYIAGLVFSRLVINQPDKGGSVKQSLFEKTADIIILGSSGAKFQYVSPMIEDSLGYSTWNSGVSQSNIFLSKCLLENFYKKCNPKLVILDIRHLQVTSFEERYILQRRFYHLNQSVKDYIDENKNIYEAIKLRSNMYCYNHTAIDILTFYWGKRPTQDMGGYSALPECDLPLVHQTYEGPDCIIQDKYYQCLLDINAMCEQHHSIFIISYSPSIIFNNGGVVRPLSEFCQAHGIRFYNFDNIDTFANYHLFKDDVHLDDEGAHLFTNLLIERLKADSIVEQFYQEE